MGRVGWQWQVAIISGRGHLIPVDKQIATIALLYGLKVVTRTGYLGMRSQEAVIFRIAQSRVRFHRDHPVPQNPVPAN